MDQQEKLEKFERIVLCHMDSAFALARWYSWNDDDAKDLVQEAALRAFKAFENFQGGDGRVWLFTIVRNLYFTSISRKPVDQAVFDEEIHTSRESSANPEVLLFRGVETMMVRQAIQNLAPEFREVLVLREMEGLSYKEIAGIIQAPMGTVMSRLARARDHLRQALAGYMKKKDKDRERSGFREGRNAVSGK